MAKFVSYQYDNPYEQESPQQGSPNPYVVENPYKYQYKNPYGYWKSTPMPDRPFINYNDPTELNSLADVIMTALNPKSLVRDFKWGGMSDIPLLNILPGMAEVLYKTTIRPIKEGDWTALALNNLMSFTENIDIVANPIKAVTQGYGWDGFKQSLGWDDDTPGRKNFDFHTGNLAADIALEILIDPLNWVTLGAKSAVTAATKTGLRAAVKNSMGEAASKGIIDMAEEGANKFIKKTVKEATEGVQSGMYKTFDEAIVKGIEFHSSNDFAARFMSVEGKQALAQVGELLRKQALDDQAITILESTSKVLAPAQAFEKKVMLGALNGTPVGAAGYLLYKGIGSVKLFANKRMVKAAEPFMTARNTINVLQGAQALAAMEREILPMSQALKRTGSDMDAKALHESLMREAIRDNLSEVKKTLRETKSALYEDIHSVTEHMDNFRSSLMNVFGVDARAADMIFDYMKKTDRPPLAIDDSFKEIYMRMASNAASLDKMLKDVRFASTRKSDLSPVAQRKLIDMKIHELHPEVNSLVELIAYVKKLAEENPEMYDRYLESWVALDEALKAEAKTVRAFKKASKKHFENINNYTQNLKDDPIIPPAFAKQQKTMQKLATGLTGKRSTQNLKRINKIVDSIIKSDNFSKISKETQGLYLSVQGWLKGVTQNKVFDTPESATEEVLRRSATEVPAIQEKIKKAANDLRSIDGNPKSTRQEINAAEKALALAEGELVALKSTYDNILHRSPLKQGGQDNLLQKLLDIETISTQEINIELLGKAKIAEKKALRATIDPDGTVSDEVATINMITRALNKTGELNQPFTAEPFDIGKYFQELKFEVRVPKGINLNTFNKTLIRNMVEAIEITGETHVGDLWDKFAITLQEFDRKSLKTKSAVVEYVRALKKMHFHLDTMLERARKSTRELRSVGATLDFTTDEYINHIVHTMDMIEELQDAVIHAPLNKLDRNSVWYIPKVDQQHWFDDMMINTKVHKALEAVLNEMNVIDPVTKSIDGVADLVDGLHLVQDSVANSRDFLSFLHGEAKAHLGDDVRASLLNSIHKSARLKVNKDLTDEKINNYVYHIIRETETQLKTILMDTSSKLELFYLDKEFSRLIAEDAHTAEGDIHLLQLVVERHFPELIKELEEKNIKALYMDIETDGRANGDITEMAMRTPEGTVYKFIQRPEIPPNELLLNQMYKDSKFFKESFAKGVKTYSEVYEEYMAAYATQFGKAQFELLEEVLTPIYSMKGKAKGKSGRVKLITWNGNEFDMGFIKRVLDQEEARIRMSDADTEIIMRDVTRINKMRSLLDGKNVSHTDAMVLYQKKKGFAEIDQTQKYWLSSMLKELFYKQKLAATRSDNFEMDLLQLPDSKLMNMIESTQRALHTYKLQHKGYEPPVTLEHSLDNLLSEMRSVWLTSKGVNRHMSNQFVLTKSGFVLDDAVLIGDKPITSAMHVNQVFRGYVDENGVKHLNPTADTGIKKGYDPMVISRIADSKVWDELETINNVKYNNSLGKLFNIVNNTADSITNTALFKRNKFTPEINAIIAPALRAHPYLKHAALGKDPLVDFALVRALLHGDQAEVVRTALDTLTDDASLRALKILYDFDNAKKLSFSENEMNFRARQMDEFSRDFNQFHQEPRPVKEDSVDSVLSQIDAMSINTPLVDLKKTIDAIEDVYSRQADFINVLHQAANTMSLHEGARALLEARSAALKPAYMLGRKIANDLKKFIRADGTVDGEGFRTYMKKHEQVQHEMARQQMKIVLGMDEGTLVYALSRSKRMMSISILGFEKDPEIVEMYLAFQRKLTPEFTARTGIVFESNMKTVSTRVLDQHVMPNTIYETPEIYDEVLNLINVESNGGWAKISEGLTEIRNRIHNEDTGEMTDAAKALRATKQRIDDCLEAGKHTVRELGDPEVLKKFLNTHLVKTYNSIYNNPNVTFTGNEISMVLSGARPDSTIVPTTLPRLDITDALVQSKLIDNTELSKLYSDVHKQQEYLIGDRLDFSMGEIAGPGLYEDFYNALSDTLKKALPDADELLHHTLMDAADTNTMTIGSALYRSIFQQGYPKSLAQVYLSSAKYHAMTADTVTRYTQLFFDEMHSINTGVLSELSNADLLAALKGAPEQRLVALVKDSRAKTGARVIELIVRNEKDIEEARVLNPIFMHYQTYSKAFQTINDFSFNNVWLRTVQKFTYLTKMGYLMTAGAVMRNVVDAVVKNAIITEHPLEMMQFYALAMRDEARYSEAIKAIIQHSKNSRIQLQSIDWYFSPANPQPSKMTREEFSRLHIFKQDGPSAGQGAEMDKAYRDSFNQTYEGWQKKLSEAQDKGDQLSIDHYKQMLATKDRTVSQEMWATANLGVEFMLQPTQMVETIARYAEYMWALEKGGLSQSEAYTMVAKTHFEYGLKNRSEYIAELVIPFYTFTMRNLEFWIDAMSNNPMLLSMIGDTMRPIWDFDSIPQEELENNRSLQYSLLQGNIEFDDTHLTLKLNPSYMDVYNILTQPPLRTDEGTIDGSMWNRVNSGIKYPIVAMLLAMQDQEPQTTAQALAAYLPAVGPLIQRYTEQAPKYAERLEGHPVSQALATIDPSVFGANSRWAPKKKKQKAAYNPSGGASGAYRKSYKRTYAKKFYPNHKAGRYESFYKKHYSSKGNSKFKMRMGKMTPKMLQFRLKDMFYYYR